MSAIIYIPSPLRRFTDGFSEIKVNGQNVKSALGELFLKYPELRKHILDETDDLRNFVNVFVDKEDIRNNTGMNTPIPENAEIRIIPSIAGGNEAISLTPGEFSRYSRHLILPEVGMEGQIKLKNARVLVVGVGGLGSPVSLYLAAAGVGILGLVDFDRVDETNLQRQILFDVETIGEFKLSAAERRLRTLNPFIQVIPHQEALTSENALEIIKHYDIVIDGTDNFPTRYLVNDACVMLKKPNVFGSIFRFDGQVTVFNHEGGPCYRCLFPEPPPPGMVPSCAEGGVLGVLPGIVGCLQAAEAIKLAIGSGKPLSGRLLLFDALSMRFTEVSIKKNEDCVVCGKNPTVTELIDYKQFCGVPSHQSNGDEEITVRELKNRLDRGEQIKILDVREPMELQIAHLSGTVNIPLNDVPKRLNELDPHDEIIVMCHSGGRSHRVMQFLKQKDYRNVKNLQGGIRAWAQEIDPSIPVY